MVPVEAKIPGPPAVMLCLCVLARDVRANVERGWPGLMAVTSRPSNLKNVTTENVWVTTPMVTFKAYFKYLAVRQGPKWSFLVRNDADLMSAWLAGKNEVSDADVERVHNGEIGAGHSDRNLDLELLVLPPTLLVIVLGVKTARNSAMPEVLLEALRLRLYAGKPTWLIDQPTCPFQDGNVQLGTKPHISWSETTADIVSSWRHIEISAKEAKPSKPAPTKVAAPSSIVDDSAPAEEVEEESDQPSTMFVPSPTHNGTRGMLEEHENASAEPAKKSWKKRGR